MAMRNRREIELRVKSKRVAWLFPEGDRGLTSPSALNSESLTWVEVGTKDSVEVSIREERSLG